MKLPTIRHTLSRIVSLGPIAVGCAALICVPIADAKPDKGKGEKNKNHKKADKADKKHKDKKHKGKDHDFDKKHAKEHEKRQKAERKYAKKHFKHFHDDHVEILQDYFTPYHETHRLPPGIAKQVAKGKGLPPGWHKKLHHGKRIDDGLWNYLVPLPHELDQRIRYHDDPYRYYILNDRIVRVHPDNRTLLGVILLSELFN
ncbi:hypothetical protein NT6N_22700 [Oceaniferula spumae]|uniref:RcnB family protein n=1 Tax=Oceaniferula spumae TaxID=2979115 RepID=A0AAT9FMM4_9BACT